MTAARPFKKILLAVDLSERTPYLIEVAAYLQKAFGAEIVAVSVVKMSTTVRGDESDGAPASDSEERLKESIAKLIEEGFGMGSTVPVKVLHGDPAERICQYAEFVSADSILIGSRGYGALKRAILGSTSSAVAESSKVSVIIVK